ncbi:hypothetical protein BZB76_4761 [Actinomadura pelletieri DSM 43383]|uniref:Uncharacterized protein n=1 Tax=Actinomadura pelletieri DSM 43383 TaxID=1120940 RepID=A0A495QIF5_9ACTN|nr:DUF6113 family protein [Actinomadura pelletieri]RKS71950.1 hypothetical protein BZB76_4761 [Actinomadura pelletieri DSM 43383]
MDDNDETRVSLAKQRLSADGEPSPGGPPSGPGNAAASDAVVTGAAYAVLGLFGALYGVVGSFVQMWSVERVPVASIVLVLVLFAAVWLAGWGMGGRTGPVVITVAWVIVVFVLSSGGPGGDLAMPAELSDRTNYAGYVYIIGGLTAAVLGVLCVRPSGPSGQWLLGRAGRIER